MILLTHCKLNDWLRMSLNNSSSLAQAEHKEVVYTVSSYEDSRNNNRKSSTDSAEYIQKARTSRAIPPKPAYDPLQFVQLKPCSLVRTAQEQVKKTENVKKGNEEKKEDPEEWQYNLDNWKSSRRKRVEHIIDRVVEVKKIELEEHDRNRRKSKTFNEMMEERGSRRLKHLPIYTYDDDEKFDDIGLGIPESLSETLKKETENDESLNNNLPRSEYSSLKYTYEEAIENYKSRVSRTAGYSHPNRENDVDSEKNINAAKCELEKIDGDSISTPDDGGQIPTNDLLERKEPQRKEPIASGIENTDERSHSDCVKSISVKERLSMLELCQEHSNNANRNNCTPANVSFTDLKNRLEIFEREIRNNADNNQCSEKSNSSSNSVVTNCKSVTRKTSVAPISLPIEKQSLDNNVNVLFAQKHASEVDETENIDTDLEDSGIHTTDVSCSVSQADDQNEESEQRAENPLPKDDDIDELIVRQKEIDAQCATDYTNDDSVLDDALESAFQEIDDMEESTLHRCVSSDTEPLYQNLKEIGKGDELKESVSVLPEPYYQVPQSREPYYEVPKNNRIPLYENVTLNLAPVSNSYENRTHFIFDVDNQLQPPKEKPPPPPVLSDDYIEGITNNIPPIRGNTHRNKIHDRRSNFVGIDIISSQETMSSPSCSASNVLLQNVSDDDDEFFAVKSGRTHKNSDNIVNHDASIMESLSYQGCNYKSKENLNIEDTRTGATEQSKELQNFIQFHIPPAKPLRSSHFLQQQYNSPCDYSSLLSNVLYQEQNQQQCLSASPQSGKQFEHCNQISNINTSAEDITRFSDRLSNCEKTTNSTIETLVTTRELDSRNMWTPLHIGSSYEHDLVDPPHSLHNKIQRKHSSTECTPQWNIRLFENKQNINPGEGPHIGHWFIQEGEQRNEQQHQVQNIISPTKSNKRKSLPESVIQTITQRVQNLGIGTERRWQNETSANSSVSTAANEAVLPPNFSSMQVPQNHNEDDETILSVSGKKKCSHCYLELGRGAAMVIESLGLLYHIDCFKCCVCHIRLGDGLKGTDVRVRKFKLHCQNCFSSEDGIKFSCV